jgi:hypothetical protein
MNSNSYSSYSVPILILVAFAIYYSNGSQKVLQPTAQEALNNKSFMLFIVYVTVILGLALISYQTKSMSVFFSMLAGLSLIWYIFGKSWQYIPS